MLYSPETTAIKRTLGNDAGLRCARLYTRERNLAMASRSFGSPRLASAGLGSRRHDARRSPTEAHETTRTTRKMDERGRIRLSLFHRRHLPNYSIGNVTLARRMRQTEQEGKVHICAYACRALLLLRVAFLSRRIRQSMYQTIMAAVATFSLSLSLSVFLSSG